MEQNQVKKQKRQLKKRADGRYRRSVSTGFNPTTGAPMRDYVYGRTIAEVNQAVKDVKEDMIKNGLVLDKHTTVGAFCDRWLAATISPKRTKSYTQYKGLIKNHIKPLLGDIPISALKQIQITEAITSIENSGTLRTAIQFRAAMKRIMDSACDEDMARKNVATRTKKPAYTAQPKRPLSESEIDILLKTDLDDEERLFVLLCLFQGMRKGEVLGLKRVTGNQIHVNSTWSSVNNKPDIKSVPKTTSGNRVFNIMPIVREQIDAVQAKHKNIFLFCNDDGTLYTEEHFKWMWKRIMTKFNLAAGGVAPMGRRSTLWAVPRITSHYLRHTYATMLYYAEFDVLQMQYLLGHNDISTTLSIYTHMDKESLGSKDKYRKWVSTLRSCFLKEKGSKWGQLQKRRKL